MTGTTPLYGIRYPDNQSKAANLGAELAQMGADVERALSAASIPPVTPAPVMVAASAAARDGYWGVPGNDAQRLTLQGRGATTIRTDTGWTEQYYALYNAATNPQGAAVPGWYPVSGMLPTGSAYNNAPQDVATGDVEIALQVPARLTGGFTLAANALRIPVTGRYRAIGQYYVWTAPGTFRGVGITRNGTKLGARSSTTMWTVGPLVIEFDAIAGDTIKLLSMGDGATTVRPQSAAANDAPMLNVSYLCPSNAPAHP